MTYSNKVILACAGSGKTWGICQDAIQNKSSKKILLVSYTNKSLESLKNEYKKQNSGVLDKNISVCTWYQFILREMIKPYQMELFKDKKKINFIKSINFENQYKRLYHKKGEYLYYFDYNNNIRVNNVSELALLINKFSKGKPKKRLEEIYSHIYIDELQDLAGRDVELLELLFSSFINIYVVGDYKQSTLKTHNAKSNKSKSGIYIFDHIKSLQEKYDIDFYNENISKRFVSDIAYIANLLYQENPIETLGLEKRNHTGVFLIEKKDLNKYMTIYNPEILRFDKRTDTMGYPAINFGASKGMTLDRVLIFPNGPLKKFLKNPVVGMNKNREKYFVGVTRSKYSLTFVVDKLYNSDHFESHILQLTNGNILCMKLEIR